jgi:DNA-binding IclR family transcriptional regulator
MEQLRTEVLGKAVAILELLADHPVGLSLARVSTLCALPKTSTHRLLLSWLGPGYVVRHANGEFALGLQAIELARRVARRNRPVEICHALLRTLQRECGKSVYFGIYRAGAVILVDAIESEQPVRVVVDLGEQCHLHASAQGLVVAAFLDENYLRQRLRSTRLKAFTARTNTSPTSLTERLARCRQEGYALNDGETVEGAVCLGAPVFAGTDGPVLGSIGISTPAFRATPAARAQPTQWLLSAAAEMSRALAGLPAEPEAQSSRVTITGPDRRRGSKEARTN